MAAAPPEAVAAFPPPPAFYKLYAGGPHAGPPPPPPLQEDVVTFGDDLISLVRAACARQGERAGRVAVVAAAATRCATARRRRENAHTRTASSFTLSLSLSQNEPFVQPLEVQRLYRIGDDGSIGAGERKGRGGVFFLAQKKWQLMDALAASSSLCPRPAAATLLGKRRCALEGRGRQRVLL